MKRLKAIFNSIRTLGRSPDSDIASAWERVKRDLVAHPSTSTEAERYLIEQVVLGVIDEAIAWKKKQGEEPGQPPA